jgi:hypothetical protein
MANQLFAFAVVSRGTDATDDVYKQHLGYCLVDSEDPESVVKAHARELVHTQDPTYELILLSIIKVHIDAANIQPGENMVVLT